MTSQKSFKERLHSLQKQLSAWEVDGCILENPIDLFYLLGLSLSAGTLLLSPKNALLFVDGRYLEVAQKISPVPVVLTGEKAYANFFKQERLKHLAFDSHWTSFQRYLRWEPLCRLKPIPQLLKEQRAIKNPQEQKAVQRSADLLQKGFKHLKKFLKEGIAEKELAFEFEFFCRKKGAEKLAFDPIVAFGEHSAMPHYRAGSRRLKKGDIVLIDIGVSLEKYHSDMTRVLFFGPANSALKKMLNIVQEAQAAAIALCTPGTTVGELDRAARAVMKREGVEQHFIHNLGHGIGLETHEYPLLKFNGEAKDVRLKPGMIITIEPGLYLPGVGGVRWEDMLLITKKGHERLTSC